MGGVAAICWSHLEIPSGADRRGPTGDVFGGPCRPTGASQGRGPRAGAFCGCDHVIGVAGPAWRTATLTHQRPQRQGPARSCGIDFPPASALSGDATAGSPSSFSFLRPRRRNRRPSIRALVQSARADSIGAFGTPIPHRGLATPLAKCTFLQPIRFETIEKFGTRCASISKFPLTHLKIFLAESRQIHRANSSTIIQTETR